MRTPNFVTLRSWLTGEWGGLSTNPDAARLIRRH